MYCCVNVLILVGVVVARLTLVVVVVVLILAVLAVVALYNQNKIEVCQI